MANNFQINLTDNSAAALQAIKDSIAVGLVAIAKIGVGEGIGSSKIENQRIARAMRSTISDI